MMNIMSRFSLLPKLIIQKSQFIGIGRLRRLAAFHLSAKLAQEAARQSSTSLTELQESRNAYLGTEVKPFGERLKQNTKTATYSAIIVGGLGISGFILYAICQELFCKESPNNVYADALERVISDPRVQAAIGAPIRGYCEFSRRGRRHVVAHDRFDREGEPHIRMQFCVQGGHSMARVKLESRKNSSGKLEYLYLLARSDTSPPETIILEDNRSR